MSTPTEYASASKTLQICWLMSHLGLLKKERIEFHFNIILPYPSHSSKCQPFKTSSGEILGAFLVSPVNQPISYATSESGN